jgi:NADH-quinone oxidoreductase subunit H
MKFACFFMSEYANMITITCVATLLFLGGWHPLFPAPYSNWVAPAAFVVAAIMCFSAGVQGARKHDRTTFPVFGIGFLVLAAIFAFPLFWQVSVPIFWFCAKVCFLLFTYIWVRGTLPRFRYDQLMHFAWTFLFPCALINLLLTALFVAVF